MFSNIMSIYNYNEWVGGGRFPPTHFCLSLIINICLVNVHMNQCIFKIMLPDFSWYNFITNALHLALRVPDDPNILGQFLTRVTGHQFVMADNTSNSDQVNSNPISSGSTSPSPGIKQPIGSWCVGWEMWWMKKNRSKRY